jgi:hypothetical protein
MVGETAGHRAVQRRRAGHQLRRLEEQRRLCASSLRRLCASSLHRTSFAPRRWWSPVRSTRARCYGTRAPPTRPSHVTDTRPSRTQLKISHCQASKRRARTRSRCRSHFRRRHRPCRRHGRCRGWSLLGGGATHDGQTRGYRHAWHCIIPRRHPRPRRQRVASCAKRAHCGTWDQPAHCSPSHPVAARRSRPRRP